MNTIQIVRIETSDITYHLLKSIDDKNQNGFLNYYLPDDILLIDRYEPLHREPNTTKALIHFMNNLMKEDRKIFIASGYNPKDNFHHFKELLVATFFRKKVISLKKV